MFEMLPSGDGYVVIASDTGHPVTGLRDSAQSAIATANILNRAASQSSRALARALGCVENGESEFAAVRF